MAARKKQQPATLDQLLGPDGTAPRSGRLQWPLSPGGGRDWLGVELHRVALNRGWALGLSGETELVRVDLSTGKSERLPALPLDGGGYLSLAIDPTGRWAVSDGQQCWVDGKPIDRQLIELCFDARGALWGFEGQQVVRLGADGAEQWRGSQRLSQLVIAGDQPIAGGYGGFSLPDGSGGFRSVESSTPGDPRALVASAEWLVVSWWRQVDGDWRWELGVWELSKGTERVHRIADPAFRGHGVILGDRFCWPSGELELRTGELRTFPIARFGATSGEILVGGCVLSPDDKELWLVMLTGACIRRFRLGDHGEVAKGPLHDARHAWDVSVAPDGRIVAGFDREWVVRDADGKEVHRAEVASQATCVCFSPDGGRLAVKESGGALKVLDGGTFAELASTDCEADAIAFSPDGAQLLVTSEDKLTLFDAATLVPVAAASTKDPLRGAHWSEGRLVAFDWERRALVFDDPKARAGGKKPATFKAAVTITNTAAGEGVTLQGGRLLAFTPDEVRAYDLETKKVASTVLARDGFVSRAGGVVAIIDEGVTKLWRLGERAAFATLPAMPDELDATADGRFVVAALHGGLALWKAD